MVHSHRSSFVSDSSSTSYPSTLSSRQPSALGLSDSPTQLATYMLSTPSTPGSTHPARLHRGSQTQLRSVPSRAALDQSAGLVQKLVRDAEERQTPKKSEAPLPRRRPDATTAVEARPSDTLSTTQSAPSVTGSGATATPKRRTAGASAEKQYSKETAKEQAPRGKPAKHPTSSENHERQSGHHPLARVAKDRPFSIPRQPRQDAISAVPPVQPHKSLGDEWEAQLVKDADNLHVSSRPGAPMADPNSQHQIAAEWEHAGSWDEKRDSAREAEDRTRRNAGREIAYPPAAPRSAIRAAPNGVTSIHVGVRPRLHPSRSEQSYQSNQPDPDLPLPLFSPLGSSQATNLPQEGEVRGSYNQQYGTDLAEKAKEEYETWLSKRTEREEGFNGEEGYGTRDWVPRSREPARPTIDHRWLQGGGPSSQTDGRQFRDPMSSDDTVQTPMDASQPFNQPIPYLNPNFYPNFWDPNMYYWDVQDQTSQLYPEGPSQEEANRLPRRVGA